MPAIVEAQTAGGGDNAIDRHYVVDERIDRGSLSNTPYEPLPNPSRNVIAVFEHSKRNHKLLGNLEPNPSVA